MSASTSTSLAEIVEDAIKNMEDPFKTTLMNSDEDSFIAFQAGWGKGIRNKYDLWNNEALVKDLGGRPSKRCRNDHHQSRVESVAGAGYHYSTGNL